MRTWGDLYRALAISCVISLVGAAAATPEPCSRLVARGDATPLDSEALGAMFGQPPEQFRRQACRDPRRLFASMMGLSEAGALTALATANAANFHWYHSTLLLRLAGELANVQGSVAPRRLEGRGEWTEALEATALRKSSQRRMGEFLVRTGRKTGPPETLKEPWSVLYHEAWFGRRGLPVHYGPVFAQVRGIRDRDGATDFYDQAWFLQAGRQGALLALYGALVEGWLYADAPNRIPGPAIAVDGKAHADFWDVSYGDEGILVVESFGETKSSIHGYANGGRKQVRRFLDAMTRGGADVRVYGHPIDMTKVRFRGADGRLLDAAAVREHLALDGWREPRNVEHDGAMPQDAKDGHWEDQFVPRFRQTFGATFFQIVLPSDEARLVEANRKYLGSFVGTVVAGAMTLEELREWFADFVLRTFADREVSRPTLDELVFADEDAERRITLRLDVGTRRRPPGRERRLPELEPLPPAAPAAVDERFAKRDYDAVLEATLASSKALAAVANDPDRRETLRLCLKKLGFRMLFRPDGTLRPITVADGEIRIAAEGRSQALTIRWSAGVKPALEVLRSGAVLTVAPGPVGRGALAAEGEPFWDSGLVGHDLQRYTPGLWIRREREALGEPSVVLKPGQAAEEESFATEAAALTAESFPLRRFFLAPPAYGKTITLARSMARLAALPRPAPGRGILLAVTGQEPVLDQIAEELEQQLPRDGKLRFVGRADKAVRKDVPTLVRYTADGDVVVPVLWSELNALRKDAAAFARLAGALRGVFIDEAQELDDKPDARATLDALTQGQTGIVVAGYSASALRPSIVSADGPFGGRVSSVYPELRDEKISRAILEAQKRAMREGMITPLRANDEGRVITYFHPETIVKALPDTELVAQYRAVRGVDPDPAEVARVRSEAAEALVGSDRYKALSAEGRAVGWLATARLLHGEGLLTQERGFFRFRLRAQAEDFFQVLEAYGQAKNLGLRFGKYFHNSPERDALLAGIRSEDPATRVDWLVTCFLMDVGVDATPLSAAVLFTQEVDPELFAQVGGRPMRLHPGKRFAHWWHIAKEPLDEEDLLESLGKKGEALEKVHLNGNSVTVRLGGAVQGPTEPVVTMPAVKPLDATTLAIPDGALDDAEQARYRLLAAAHERVFFADAKTDQGALADLLDFARLTAGLRASLQSSARQSAEVGEFVIREAQKILRGQRRRHGSNVVKRTVFGRVLEGIVDWMPARDPEHAATWLATLALLDVHLVEEALRRAVGEEEWPVRLRNAAVAAVRIEHLASANWSTDPIEKMVERLDALGLPGDRPALLGPRLRGYLAERLQANEALANDSLNVPDRPEAQLELAEKLERALTGRPDHWEAFDRIAKTFRPAIEKCLRAKHLAALTSEAPPNEGLAVAHFPVDEPSVLANFAFLDDARVQRWIDKLERVRPGPEGNLGGPAQKVHEEFLEDLALHARKYFVTYAEYVLGWSRRDQPEPPWEIALADLKRLRRQKKPSGRVVFTMRLAPELPFERAFDPELKHTFVIPPETEVLSDAERADGFEAWPVYRRAVLEWMTNGEDLVTAEEVQAGGRAYTPPSERRYQAVERLFRKTARLVALYRRLTDADRARFDGFVPDEFERMLWLSTRRIGRELLDAGHPASGYSGLGPVRSKRATFEKVLGSKAIVDEETPEGRDEALRAAPSEFLEAIRRLAVRENGFYRSTKANATTPREFLSLFQLSGQTHAYAYCNFLFPWNVKPGDAYGPILAAIDRERQRRDGTLVEKPVVWKRPDRPRDLGKETPEEARVWAYVDRLGEAAVRRINAGEPARSREYSAAQMLSMVELRVRFDESRGGKPTALRKELEALAHHFRDVSGKLSEVAGQAPIDLGEWEKMSPEGRAGILVNGTNAQFVGLGPELFAWAVLARRALREGANPPEPPEYKRLAMETPLQNGPLTAAAVQRQYERLRDRGLLPAGAVLPDAWVEAIGEADLRMQQLGAEARQELRRRSDGRGDDARVARLFGLMRLNLPLLVALADMSLPEEYDRALPLFADGADPETGLRWLSAFSREWQEKTERLHVDRSRPLAQWVEYYPRVYSGTTHEDLEQLLASHRGSLTRATRDPSRIELPKLGYRESPMVENAGASQWGDLGRLLIRLRRLREAAALAKSAGEGNLGDPPWAIEAKDFVEKGKLVEGFPRAVPDVPTEAELATPTEPPLSADEWQKQYMGWVFAPAGLVSRRTTLSLGRYRETTAAVLSTIDFCRMRIAQVRRLFATLPPGDLPVMGGTREAFVRSHVQYLQTLRKTAEELASGKVPAVVSPTTQYVDVVVGRSLKERLSLVSEEELHFLKDYATQMETELDAIAAELKVDWRKNRRWLEAAFAKTDLLAYLGAIAPSKSTPLPKTPEEVRTLVDEALVVKGTVVLTERKPFRFEAQLRALADRKDSLGKMLRALEDSWESAQGLGLDAAGRERSRLRWAAAAVGIIFVSQSVLGSLPSIATFYDEIEAMLPVWHPWKSTIATLARVKRGERISEQPSLESGDAVLICWAINACQRIGEGQKLDELPPPALTPTGGPETMQRLPLDVETARAIVRSLEESGQWTVPAEFADKPLDAFLAALDFARAKAAAFKTVVVGNGRVRKPATDRLLLEHGRKVLRLWRTLLPEDTALRALEEGRPEDAALAQSIGETEGMVSRVAGVQTRLVQAYPYGSDTRVKYQDGEAMLRRVFLGGPPEIYDGFAHDLDTMGPRFSTLLENGIAHTDPEPFSRDDLQRLKTALVLFAAPANPMPTNDFGTLWATATIAVAAKKELDRFRAEGPVESDFEPDGFRLHPPDPAAWIGRTSTVTPAHALVARAQALQASNDEIVRVVTSTPQPPMTEAAWLDAYEKWCGKSYSVLLLATRHLHPELSASQMALLEEIEALEAFNELSELMRRFPAGKLRGLGADEFRAGVKSIADALLEVKVEGRTEQKFLVVSERKRAWDRRFEPDALDGPLDTRLRRLPESQLKEFLEIARRTEAQRRGADAAGFRPADAGGSSHHPLLEVLLDSESAGTARDAKYEAAASRFAAALEGRTLERAILDMVQAEVDRRGLK